MSYKKVLVVLIGSVGLLLAASVEANAEGLPGPMSFSIDAQIIRKNVLVTLKVKPPIGTARPGGNVVVTPCKFGPQQLVLAHRTRHLANGESLRPYKYGPGWVYQFPPRRANNPRPFVLKMPFKLIFNKGGSGFTSCVYALAVDFSTGQYIRKDLGFGVA